ncbi:MAG: hypothetical protein ACYSU0_04055, partial [Planctomycetota bacterium]
RQLEVVQKGLRRSGREMVLSGGQALVRGVFVLVGCGGSFALMARPWWQMAGLWGGIAVLTMVVETLLYLRLARKRPDKYVTGIERQLVKIILLIVATGGMLTVVAVRREQADLIPGMWMLLVGVAYVTVGLISFSRTWILGLCASIGGGAALFLGPTHSLLVLGVILGLGSVVWAVVLKAAERTVE